MPNSKAKSVARKHQKAKSRRKALSKASRALAKNKVVEPKKKISVFERARLSSLSGAFPSAVSNPTGGNL